VKRSKRSKLDPLDRLYQAAADYIEWRGGTVVVVGGVEVQRWPTERKFNYTLGIRVTGRPPTQDESEVSE